MSKLQAKVTEKAKQLREQLGGTIFSFPIEEGNPFSSYAVVMYADGKYFTYPDATDISMAAAGVLIILEELKKIGQDADYEKNVRLISHQAQMDAPSTVMRRLKKGNIGKPFLVEGKDFKKGIEGEDEQISARGLLKISYLQMVEERNQKASQFMDRYYQLLAMRKYGKTAAAIRQEVRKMGKDQVLGWLEQTHEKYVRNDMEVMNILNGLGGKKT